MLSPVSMASVQPRVHFGDSNVLNREGAYASKAQEVASAAPETDEEKKSSLGKKLAIGAGVVLAVAATLAALKKFNVLKVLPKAELEKAAWYKKPLHYMAVAGEKIIEYGYRKPKNWITGLFKSKKPAAPGS